MGRPSFYHATVALSFQIEICNLDSTKSSFLAAHLYKKVIITPPTISIVIYILFASWSNCVCCNIHSVTLMIDMYSAPMYKLSENISKVQWI